jgi:hypothetical protein
VEGGCRQALHAAVQGLQRPGLRRHMKEASIMLVIR